MTPVMHDTHARPAQLLPDAVMPPAVIGQWRSYFGFGGIVGLGAILVGFGLGASGGFWAKQHFFRAYLVGFMLCLGLTLGSLVLLLLQHVTGGKWGLVIRRP